MTSVNEAIKETLDKAGGKYRVVAVGLTNQRETTVAWDKTTGKALTPAIVWSDVRTAPVCRAIQSTIGGKDGLRDVTGLPVSTYFSAYKLRWMVENVPEVAAALEAGRLMFGTVDSWVLYNLTGGVDGGVHVTDVSNASRTSLMDIERRVWDRSAIELFGFEKVHLPEIRSNAERYGEFASGPLRGVPLCGCLGDQQAAVLGQRCAVGEAKNTYGTGCFMLLNTGTKATPSKQGLLTTVAYQLGADAPAEYALEGAIAVAGQGVSWLRDNLGLFADAAESESVAGSVPTSGGVYLVPAFGGLLAPWWRDDARGVLVGLTQYTTKAHVVRAMLEAIAFQTVDVLRAMEADSGQKLSRLAVDGGATGNSLLMQIQADLIQSTVARPANQETTSMGAAIAAGIAVGYYDRDKVFATKGDDSDYTVFEPRISAAAADKRHGKWKLAVERALALDTLADEEDGSA